MNQQLVKEREMAGLSKAHVAKFIGVSAAMYAMMEKGVRGVSDASAKRLGELYQKDSSEFRTKALIGDGNMAPLPNAPADPPDEAAEPVAEDEADEAAPLPDPDVPYVEDDYTDPTPEEREAAEEELAKLLEDSPDNVTLEAEPPPIPPDDSDPMPPRGEENVIFGEIKGDDWVTKMAPRIDMGEGVVLRSHGVFDSAGQFFEGVTVGPSEQCVIKTGVRRAKKYEGFTAVPIPELLLRSELWVCQTPIWIDDEMCVVAYAHAVCLIERGMPVAMLV